MHGACGEMRSGTGAACFGFAKLESRLARRQQANVQLCASANSSPGGAFTQE
jgi:hypothetical protein